MKRFLILAALAAVLAVGAACGDDGGGATTGTADTGAATAPAQGATGETAAPATGDNGEAVSPLPPLTTDPVHLTFSTWHNIEHNQFTLDMFTARHPNITVEVMEIPLDGYMDSLLALAAAGNLPDIWGFLNLAAPVNNGWFLDFSEFWFDDPDVNYYLESLRPHTLIDGRAVRMVEGYLPTVVYLDRTVFTLLNEPMPSFDWTYEEMIELVPRLTRPDLGIFGFNFFIGPVTYAPIVLTDGLSEFGWDGENYNMRGPWADSMNMLAEWRRLGFQAIIDTDEWEAVSGDRHLWPGASGRVAMQMDAWWTFNNIYLRDEYRERGIDMIPYVVPRGATALTNRKPAFLDFAGISAATAHPREAYEVLKWLSFMPDAWHYRIQNFQEQLTPTGERFYIIPDRFPVTNDPGVWAAFRELMPVDDGDTFMGEAFDAFLRNSHEPVPLGGQGILGFAEWLHEVYFNGEFNGVIGIESAVFQGAVDAHDVAADLEASGRAFYEAALATFRAIYGPPPN
ncbi:MAG: extracellular solute-binding protein [Defluviitaleaceae bacterium]|nr:extracellular solute-binding protein [Defluviitaleaceae bacterium]